CGITRDFCIDTNTSPPGTAKQGTYSCISNCSVNVIKGAGSSAIKLAYFQGYSMNRKCLYQDALQINTSKYTYLHFRFSTLTPTYEVEEYPSAPNLPNFNPSRKEDSPNYLAFLTYLKQFPIKEISRVINYIIYMTYDLHRQWDAYNKYSQENCNTGNCLRSQVNLTKTRQALAMVTKASVPGEKIVVGVTSYGCSCKFTSDRLTSYATPGQCTATAGYIADAEIKEIINGSDVQSFLNASSNSNILIYNDNQ
ncbi:Killer toxin subunits alpha/beta, partial [Colletotrichum tanaceti]